MNQDVNIGIAPEGSLTSLLERRFDWARAASAVALPRPLLGFSLVVDCPVYNIYRYNLLFRS